MSYKDPYEAACLASLTLRLGCPGYAALELLVEKKISGLPVIDDDNRVVCTQTLLSAHKAQLTDLSLIGL